MSQPPISLLKLRQAGCSRGSSKTNPSKTSPSARKRRRQIGDLRDIPQVYRPVNRGRRRRVGAPGVPRDEQGARLAKTLFWPAAGETPPSSSTARSGVKQLREVDGID